MTLASKRNLLGGPAAPLAVTGLGLLTPVGAGVAAFQKALEAQRSALGPLHDIPGPGSTDTGGLVRLVPPGVASRSSVLASQALAEAIADARIEAGRLGLYVGTALGDLADRGDGACAPASPDYVGLASRLAKVVARSAPGACLVEQRIFSVTCVSGLCALEQAAADLAFDRIDLALVGGVDSLSRFMQAGFKALGALSTSGCLRPFDIEHDGILLGEAAGFVVVEPETRALERGAGPHACVVGQALLSDARHLTSPDPEGSGMAEAIRRALATAGLTAARLGGVLVTAVGSAVYDRMLSRALHAALGPAVAAEIPVSTWESATGHLLGSTGVVGYVHAARAATRRCLEPLPRPITLDPECRLNHVFDSPVTLRHGSMLSLTVGFGGQNGAAVLVDPALLQDIEGLQTGLQKVESGS